jgi:hypothetical protein
MSRSHFWSHVFDSEGRPLVYEDIYVYFAGGTSPALIYTQEIGGTAISVPPQLRTDRRGFYEFWVGDVNEVAGYPRSQKFKVSHADGSVDNISVLPITPQVANTTTSLWITAGIGGYYSDCSHYLDNTAPLVQCWNLTSSEVEEPTVIDIITSDIVRVYFPTNLNRYAVTVVG